MFETPTGEFMIYVAYLLAVVVLLCASWYVGHLHGMATMSDLSDDCADKNANPDAND